MKIRNVVLAVLVCAMYAPAAHAGSKIMATGPGSRTYPSIQTLDCNILNANKEAKPVTIDVMDYFGNVVSTSGPLVIASYTGASVTDTSFDGAWCRFTVDGSTKKYRAAAVYGAGSGYTSTTPAR